MGESMKRRRHRKAHAIAVPTTGVLAMAAIAVVMLVVALTDVELSFDFSADDGSQTIATEQAN